MQQTADIVVVPQNGTPAQIYEALTASRRELRQALSSLESRRTSIARELPRTLDGAARKGLEDRVIELDKQIAIIEKQMNATDMLVSKAAAVPGAIVEPPPRIEKHPNDADYTLIGIFGLVLLVPSSIAFARRIWRRSAAKTPPTWPAGLADRLDRLESAVEATAVEIERVGEGQRYVTAILTEGAAQPLGVNTQAELRRIERATSTTPH